MKLAGILGSALLFLTAGCASVYVNDPGLAQQADSADAAVQGADTLKPYTTQLANLNAYGGRLDLAVASRDVAIRDQVVTGFIGLRSANGKVDEAPASKALDADACRRLGVLAGGDPCAKPISPALANVGPRLATDTANASADQETVTGSRQAYEAHPATGAPKDDCASLAAAPAVNAAAGLPELLLRNLQLACGRLAAAQAAVNADTADAGLAPDSPIVQAAAQSAPAPAQKAAAQGDAQLQAAIDAAKALASGGDVSRLAAFQKQVESALSGLSSAAKLAGLDRSQQDLANTLTGILCSPPPASGTDCSGVAKSSTVGRAAAVWSVLQTIAQTLDADDKRYRSANWLAAANAILAAEKTDVTLQANADAEASANAHARLTALTTAASALAQAHQYASGASPCLGTTPFFCGLSAYVSAWNSGLIPADVLRWRETLIFSRAALERQQAAQTEQQSLARAASASLKAYADGGLQPKDIAQLLFDAGLLGAAAAK